MKRHTIAPVLTEFLADEDGWASEQDYPAMRRELRRMKRALTLAADLLRGVDALMNEEPLVMFRGRGYLVQKSAALRGSLSRLHAGDEGKRRRRT